MRCVNSAYESLQQLQGLIAQEQLDQAEQLLVQIFCGSHESARLEGLLKMLRWWLPRAVIIGASTAGEILEGKMQEQSIVLSFARFENTRLIPLRHNACTYEAGIELASALSPQRVKGAIIFTEGLSGQPEALLEGITARRPDLIISGGAAADNGRFKKTVLIQGDRLYEHGVAGVAFDNPDLIINIDTRLGYAPLGKSMTVTKAQGPKLIALDDRPVREVIGHYLGQHTLENLPASIVQFPLLKEESTPIARAPVKAESDGLIYAGGFKTGERVRFGIADTEALLAYADSGYAPRATPVEGMWIYSCMGRKAFLGKTLEAEFAALGAGRCQSGFFTYGEFFHSGKNHMLNLTTTVLTLSEGGNTPVQPATPKTQSGDDTLRTFSHLINTITAELDDAVAFLEGYRLATDEISLISRSTPEGVITYVNDAFCAACGYSREELLGNNHRILRHPQVEDALFKQMWETIAAGQIWRGFLPSRAKSGETYQVDMVIVPIKDGHGRIVEYIAARHDVTRLLAQEKTIAEKMTDPLTLLPNRNAFVERLSAVQEPVVALLNVDRFRDINSFYGFKAGDLLLKELAQLLGSLAQPRFGLYRIGGDLFALLGEGGAPESIEADVRAVLRRVSQTPFLEQSFAASIRLSAGIASGSWQILSRAEAALNRAQEKRCELTIADEKDERTAQANLKMIGVLKQAVAQPWWVVPYYQPIARASDGHIGKYEALMRLRDADGVTHGPFAFLELAKHSRYYPDLTRIMIRHVFDRFKDRTEAVALNLAAEDIQNPQTVAFLKQAVTGFGDPGRITLEVTETEMIEDYETVIGVIGDLKALGVKIAIDDFGSGYSNFAYLIRFRADYLKIDGSIVRQIVEDENAYHTLCAIVDLAKRMGIETVAEFISSEEIALKAKEAGVDYWQGYFIAPPAPL